MNHTFRTVIAAIGCILSLGGGFAYAKPADCDLYSPSGKLHVRIENGSFSAEKNGTAVIAPSSPSMTLDDGSVWSISGKPVKIKRGSVDNTITTPVYKKAEVRDRYNWIRLSYKDYDFEMRAYDATVSYRFLSRKKGSYKVMSEKSEFAFPGDFESFTSYVGGSGKPIAEQFQTSFESTYDVCRFSTWQHDRLAFLPITFPDVNGYCVCITESNLRSYPGMFIQSDGNSITGTFAQVPAKVDPHGSHSVLERKSYIAECSGAREFPWRIISVNDSQKDLLDNDDVFVMGAEASDQDWSWVKPGKVAWDWWNDWAFTGVDFKAGINDDTYKKYIDFAAANGLEYIIMDEGWAERGKANLFLVVPEIHLDELVKYASDRNVGIILWGSYWSFMKDRELIFKHYSEMGIKGFKIDFMNRDDQQMVDFFWDCASLGAKYHMLIDFHGSYKPSGLQRTFPNVVNQEGVWGLENAKWTNLTIFPRHDCILPFTRMAAGCLDYTPGAMINVTEKDYHPSYHMPASQGTRCHQIALYTIFEAPLNMLCDSPSKYEKEPECTSFISGIPTVWEETKPLLGKIGEYVAIARRKGNVWYVGAIGDWNARDLSINLDFLAPGIHKAVIFADGINSDINPTDFSRSETEVQSGETLNIHLAQGGGWSARIE